MSLLKPPPAFPVQDSPAKLQPAVSYASKVKQGGAGSVAEDLPGIGVLLQNQWGLSFISDSPQNADSSGPTTQNDPSHGSPLIPSFGSGVTDPAGNASLVSDGSVPTVSPPPVGKCGLEAESPPELLLGCRHLVEALRYHTQGESRRSFHCSQVHAFTLILVSSTCLNVLWCKMSPYSPSILTMLAL